MLRNGYLQADFGSEMLICGWSEVKEHNVTAERWMMKGRNVWWWWCRVEIIACDEEKRGCDTMFWLKLCCVS